jgi:hypothetical protein
LLRKIRQTRAKGQDIESATGCHLRLSLLTNSDTSRRHGAACWSGK